MSRPDSYWQARLLQDRRLADRAAEEVAREVNGALRGQYLQVARRLDELYAEAQAKGTLSRSKLWAYRSYRDLEKDLRKYSEAGCMIQEEALTKCLNKVFEDVIGAPAEQFNPKNVLLPYSPRAFIDTAWSGENYSARIWKNTNKLADQIRTEAQLVVQGLKSPGQIKRELMHDYDVSFHQAERLIDTEISYVLNKANLEQYRRYGVGKVTIVNLDVNTCEKCKALEGQVFAVEDAPVLPIHPRCHCSYCVPAEGDDAEVTASGSDLASVYADAGIEGYERVPVNDGRKIVFSMAEIQNTDARIKATSDEQMDKIIDRALNLGRKGAIIGVEDVESEAQKHGGRHHGKLTDAMQWKPSSLRKSARSYQSTVEEHFEKIANPEAHDSEWNQKSELRRTWLMEKWQGDARRNAELLAVIRLVAKMRGVDLHGKDR